MKVSEEYNVEVLFPEITQWWSPQNHHPPRSFTPKSMQRAWFVCPLGHEWETSIGKWTQGTRCPFCQGSKVLVGYNDLETVNPELAAQWDYLRNSKTPQDVTQYSNYRAHWVCSLGHKWEVRINSRSTFRTGCPVCEGKKVLEGFNDLASQFPSLVTEWDWDANELPPTNYLPGSNKVVGWKCSIGHRWKTSPNKRTCALPTGCPICSGNKIEKGFNDLLTTDPQIAAEVDTSKSPSPDTFSKNTHQKVWWLCPRGHSYQAIVKNRIRQNSGCAECNNTLKSSEVEREIYRLLSESGLNVSSPKLNLPWGRSKYCDVDILIDTKGTVIEYDGEYWHREKIEMDMAKTQALLTAGYQVIRVRENNLPFLESCPGLFQIRWKGGSDPSLLVKQLLRLISP